MGWKCATAYRFCNRSQVSLCTPDETELEMESGDEEAIDRNNEGARDAMLQDSDDEEEMESDDEGQMDNEEMEEVWVVVMESFGSESSESIICST